MNKERIEVTIVSAEEKKESTLLPFLLNKWKLLLFSTLVGLLLGGLGVFSYYRSIENALPVQITKEVTQDRVDIAYLSEPVSVDENNILASFLHIKNEKRMIEVQITELYFLHAELFGTANKTDLVNEVNIVERYLKVISEDIGEIEQSDYLNISAQTGEVGQYPGVVDGESIDPLSAKIIKYLQERNAHNGEILNCVKNELLRIYESFIVLPATTVTVVPSFSTTRAGAILCIGIAIGFIIGVVIAIILKLLQKERQKQ